MQVNETLTPAAAEGPLYPSLLKRVQSIVTDGIFLLILMFVITKIIDHHEETPGWLRAVLFIGLWFVYEPVCIAFGCTAGNWLLGIRVRKFSNPTKKINLFNSYERFVVKFLLGWLSYITMHINPQKRAIHDFASGSVMIELPGKE